MNKNVNSLTGNIFLKFCSMSFMIKWFGYSKSIEIFISLMKLKLTKFDILLICLSSSFI